MMLELFGVALDELDRDCDLVNQVIEVTAEADNVHIIRYMPPAD